MPLDERIAEALRAGDAATSWHEVSASLHALDPEGEDLAVRPFYFAFSYTLLERSSPRRERVGEPFGSRSAGEGWRFPPEVSAIEDVDVEAWMSAFEEIDSPVVTARVGDLLFERRAGSRPDFYARGASDALLALVDRDEWGDIERTRLLSRAFELAQAVGDRERAEAAIARILAFAECELDNPESKPGVCLRPLRSLVDLAPEDRPDNLDQLLVRAAERFGADPNLMDNIVELRVRLLDGEERKELRQDQVARWREEATKGEGLLRAFRLEKALEIARTFGLNTEADELRKELGDFDPEQLDLKEISAEVEMPKEEVERFLSNFRDAASWQDALRFLAAQPPPGGSPADLEAYVEELMTEAPLQFLFTKAIIGPESAGAIFRADSPEKHKKVAMSEQRTQAASFWALFAADGLDVIGDTFGRPSHDELSEFFAGALVDVDVAERMARALELYWDGHPDESAHILVPRIEQVIRGLARRLGVPVYREPRGSEPGGVETLGTLLRAIGPAFADAGLHAYLVVLLTDPLGLNFRNKIAHGLIGKVQKPATALLLQAACVLTGFELRTSDERAGPPPGAEAVGEPEADDRDHQAPEAG
jgi:hypothetical protein